MNNILVTGGAGYIGSHIVEQLVNTKAKIIIIDNLVTGYRKLINNKAIFIKGDVKNLSPFSTAVELLGLNSSFHCSILSFVVNAVLSYSKS